jgi:RimJ/RimL family protein N-acetyltransferase/aryl carrier-like protein
MTLMDTPMPALSRSETLRAELALVIDRPVTELTDDAQLNDDLSLDSLAMMALTAWLQEKGVAVAKFRQPPGTVGEVLAILGKSAEPAVTVKLNGSVIGPPRATPVRAPQDPLAPELSSVELRLTPVEPDDVRFLYSMSVHPETAFRWRYRGNPPPVDRFAADLWHQVMVQFVVRLPDGEPIGHVVAYGADTGQRYAYAGAVFRADFTGSGLGARAFSMFLRYLFHTFPMRKFYVEIPGFNWPQISSGEGKLFEVEGVMREHEFYAGRYWDRYLCAIYPHHVGMLPPA